jgi:hypothetical protein
MCGELACIDEIPSAPVLECSTEENGSDDRK